MRKVAWVHFLYIGMVVLAAVCFSTMGVAVRGINGEAVSPLFVAWMRALFSAIVAVVYTFVKYPEELRFTAKEFPSLFIHGIVCVAVMYVGVNFALLRLPIGVAILLFYTTPLWVIVGTRLLRLEVLTRIRVIALVLGVLGVWFAVGGISGATGLDPLGILGAIMAGLTNGIYMIAGRYGLGKGRPIRMFTHMFLWGAVALGLVCFFRGDFESFRSAQMSDWMAMLYLAFIPSVFGNILIMKSLQCVPASVVSIVAMSEIAFGMLWAWLFFAEIPSASAFAGGVFLFLAIVIVTMEGERVRRKELSELL